MDSKKEKNRHVRCHDSANGFRIVQRQQSDLSTSRIVFLWSEESLSE